MVGNTQWAPTTASPWYQFGVWLVIYGTIIAAPSSVIAFLLWVGSAIGILTPTGELYAMALVTAFSVPVVLIGWLLIRREQRDLRQLRQLDRRV